MSKTTTVTTSYTTDIELNGYHIPDAYHIISITAGRTQQQMERVKVNGTDVVHRFRRTVVRAYSNLTFTIVLRYNVRSSTSCGYSWYDFDSPIYLDITVTNTAGTSSGFTSITGVQVATQYYCGEGNLHSGDQYFYANSMSSQSFTLGQQKTLTFSYYNGKEIDTPTSPTQEEKFRVFFLFTDPDGVNRSAPDITVKPEYHSLADTSLYVNQTLTGTRVVNNVTLSDNTVQEY